MNKSNAFINLRVIIIALLAISPAKAFAAAQIITTIAPLQQIANAILGDVGSAQLLIDDGSSPHNFRLQPSIALSIQKSDLIIWAGPDLESKLARPLQQLSGRKNRLGVLDLPLPSLLHNRQPGPQEHNSHQHADSGIDPHVWLDPDNAIAIAKAISNRISEIDPENTNIYRRNYKDFKLLIEKTDADIKKMLTPVQNQEFLVLHDALQYFEEHYSLHSAGILNIDSRSSSAKRLHQLKSVIDTQNIKCVFYEQMPDHTILDVLLEGSSAHAVVIDPLGLNNKTGFGNYSDLLLDLANVITDCLSDTES